MVEDNEGKLGTNFTVSIDASSGLLPEYRRRSELKQSIRYSDPIRSYIY